MDQRQLSRSDPRALFVYGTLLFRGVVRALIGRVPDRSPGVVAGWRAAALPGRPYPGLVPAVGATATGRLLTGLTAAEWRILDAFEEGYDRTEVTLIDGRPAWTYTWVADVVPLPADWSAGEFAAQHLAGYVVGVAAWRAHRETGDPERRPARPRRLKVEGDLYHGRVPGGAVYVGRAAPGLPASPFANPFSVKKYGRDEAVRRYRERLLDDPELVTRARAELAGKDLACWCHPADRCHADVLLDVANRRE